MAWRKSQGNWEDVRNRWWKSCLYDTNWFQLRLSTFLHTVKCYIASFSFAAWRPCNPTCESVSITWWSWSKETKSKFWQVHNHERRIIGDTTRLLCPYRVFRKDLFGPRFGDGANSTDIHAMLSGEGEEIPFYKMLKALQQNGHIIIRMASYDRHQMRALSVEPPERGWKMNSFVL